MHQSTKLKICFVAGTLGRGGAERQLIYMLQSLKQLGVELRLLSLTKGESFEKQVHALDIPVQWIGGSGSRARRLRCLIDELRRDCPDILQSAHFFTNIYVAVASRILGLKEIGAIRNDLFSEVASSGFLGRWQLKLPRFIIANSDLAMRRAVKMGRDPQRIAFVRNVVGMKQSPSRPNGHRNEVRVLFVGRLVRQKRPDLFLKVVAELARQSPGRRVTGMLAGEGPLKPELAQLASELEGTRGRFEFLGECGDVTSLYQQADILVLPSDHEGTPNVVLEAMANQLPVVATRVGGVPEILGPDRGMLCEPGDTDCMVAAAVRLLEKEEYRTSVASKAMNYVHRFHSLDSLGGQLMNVYDRVLAL